MFIQITAAGALLLQQGPFVLTEYKLGDAANYVPDVNQAGLLGAEIWSGTPGSGLPLSANVIRYSALIDRSVGDFDFGEIGFYVGSVLVAIGVSSTMVRKTKTQTGVDGNFIRIDAFLSMVGTTYEMWLNLGDTDNPGVIADINSVDQLPATADATTNMYIVDSANSNQLQFLAYSNREGLWAFDQYKYSVSTNVTYTVASATATTIRINGAANAQKLDPVELGEFILQFITGALYSICRNIKQAIKDIQNDQTVLVLDTPLAVLPQPATKFTVYTRDPLNSKFVDVDVATTSSTGVVQIGQGLDVDPAGIVKVNRTQVDGGLVYSLIDKNGTAHQGDVTLVADMVEGVVQTVNNKTPVDGDVELDSTDVGAIPLSEKGKHGGTATLDGTPQDTDPYLLYVRGRLPKEQAPLDSLTYKGVWDADVNNASYTDSDGLVHNLVLKNNGLIDDTVSSVTTELPGSGSVFRVGVAGATALDGYLGFAINDLVVGIPGRWFRIPHKQTFQISLSMPGDILPNELLLYQVLANNLARGVVQRAVCQVAPSSTAVLPIKVNNIIEGSVTFIPGSTTGIVDAPAIMHVNDVLSVESPSVGLTGLSLALTFTVEE